MMVIIVAMSSAAAATANAAAPVESPAKRLRIEIGNSKPGTVAVPLRATQGESLTIDIASDRAGTLEIHGYGKKIDVAPGSVVTLSFVANLAGRFPVDLHGRDGRHLEVTALEVQPR
jgi:copper(I)-binding protein